MATAALLSAVTRAVATGLGGAIGAGVGAQVGGAIGATAMGSAFAAAASVAGDAIGGAVSREYAEGGESATTSAGVRRRFRSPLDESPPVNRPTPDAITTAEAAMQVTGLTGPYDPTELWALARDSGVDVDRVELYRQQLLQSGYTAAYVDREVRRILKHAWEHRQLETLGVGSVFGLTDGNLVLLDAMRDAPAYVEPMKNTSRPEPRGGIGRLEGETLYDAWYILAEAWGLSLDPQTRIVADTPANRARVDEIAASRNVTAPELFFILAAVAEQARNLDDWRSFLNELNAPGSTDATAIIIDRDGVAVIGEGATDTTAHKPGVGSGAMWAVAAVAGVGVLGGGIYLATRTKKRKRRRRR